MKALTLDKIASVTSSCHLERQVRLSPTSPARRGWWWRSAS